MNDWNGIKGGFLDHLDEVNKQLVDAGLPTLESGAVDDVPLKSKNVVNGVNGVNGTH